MLGTRKGSSMPWSSNVSASLSRVVLSIMSRVLGAELHSIPGEEQSSPSSARRSRTEPTSSSINRVVSCAEWVACVPPSSSSSSSSSPPPQPREPCTLSRRPDQRASA